MNKKHIEDWITLCAAIQTQFARQFHPNCDVVDRMALAVLEDNVDEMNHLSAVMLCMIIGMDDVVELRMRWFGLDQQFHTLFCQHEICVKRRLKK